MYHYGAIIISVSAAASESRSRALLFVAKSQRKRKGDNTSPFFFFTEPTICPTFLFALQTITFNNISTEKILFHSFQGFSFCLLTLIFVGKAAFFVWESHNKKKLDFVQHKNQSIYLQKRKKKRVWQEQNDLLIFLWFSQYFPSWISTQA